jgi:hypothetical protein
MERHSYKTALRVKGILPIPPYHQMRSAGRGAHEIINPALRRGARGTALP